MPEISPYYQPALTLPDLLKRVADSSNELYIGYVSDKGDILKQSYSNLYAEATRIASGLFSLGLKQGDTLIIATRTNQETLELLWGCFLMGVVPTVLQPPLTFSGYNPAVEKILQVSRQLGEPYLFLSPETGDAGKELTRKVCYRNQLDCSGSYPVPVLKPHDLAFIQFSSGSTGDPKGIMLTHYNLMVNLDAIRIGLDLHFPDHVGNWMPLFHDMGLIGYHLTPMYCITRQFHLDTIDFIMKPGLWMDLMGKHQIAISGVTNFALALVLRYLKRGKPVSDWDFSTMKALLNGAEPISVKIMSEFVSAVEQYRFRPEAMMPVYGMAEATLAISFTPLMKPSVIGAFSADLLDRENKAVQVSPEDTGARVLSGVGVALNDVEIRIVDGQGNVVNEGICGNIQLRGDGITKGYFQRPDATADAFDGPWLKTGDVGFFFGKTLFISGRSKDIIFKNGRNYFANDLEEIACTLDEFTHGKICFAAHTDKTTGSDKVVAFAAGIPETKSRELFTKLRNRLRSHLGITVDELVLIKSNEIPKTSSGKLQRYKLMQRYLGGDFDKCRILPDDLQG